MIMTREEEKAIYAKKYYPDDFNCYYAFMDGACWSDKHPVNVWHDASEEPLLEEKEIISINEQGFAYISERFGATFSYNLEDYSWQTYVNLLKIKRWAYISDLSPKGFKK